MRGSVNWGTGGWLTSMEKEKAAVRTLFQSQNIARDRPHGWWDCEQSANGIGTCQRETSASGWSARRLSSPGMWIVVSSKSCNADKNQILHKQSCMPSVLERPELRASMLLLLSQRMMKRWPQRAGPQSFSAAMIVRSSRTLMLSQKR